ncbi:MAG: hypothetical protein RIB03_10680 [Henriciella sp.]|uniref:hypothetical protein n=1 Tax=Henriciella sp. TaxID=1968823 RepID=UPI0032ECE7FC
MNQSPFPSEVQIERPELIELVLGDIGLAVPPRTGPVRRTSDHRDWWLLRRWLKSLAYKNLLQFPLKIERPTGPGGPDFIYRTVDREPIGLEMTEAGPQEDQAERTKFARSKLKVSHYGDFGGRSYESETDSELQTEYISFIMDAVQRKLAKAKLYLERCSQLELMIYVNNNVGIWVSLFDVSSELQSSITSTIQRHQLAGQLSEICILDHKEMLLISDGKVQKLEAMFEG